MAITSNVSLLAQSLAQSRRLSDLRSNLDTLQRQVSTQKKYDTFTGFGVESFNVQTLRVKTPLIETYVKNIDKAADIMEQMTSVMTQVSEIGNDLAKAINLRETDAAGIDALAEYAQSNLNFIQELLNQRGVDGFYLFSGSDVSSPPFVDNPGLQNNFRNQATQWLNGTITPNQMLTNIGTFGTANLGLASGLDTAAGRTIRVADNIDVDYSIKANIDGMQDILRAVTMVANLRRPTDADVATVDDMDGIYNDLANVLQRGITDVNNESQRLASKFSLVKSVRENHMNDLELFTKQLDTLENADPSEALIKMQVLQTQLEASYQITSILGELSLTNFI